MVDHAWTCGRFDGIAKTSNEPNVRKEGAGTGVLASASFLLAAKRFKGGHWAAGLVCCVKSAAAAVSLTRNFWYWWKPPTDPGLDSLFSAPSLLGHSLSISSSLFATHVSTPIRLRRRGFWIIQGDLPWPFSIPSSPSRPAKKFLDDTIMACFVR